MIDYSIEMAAEGIIDSRTKRYFSEVYGCYSAGYYRSTVVMLWSIVVTDIMFKLDQLATAYSDTTAQAILSEIGTLRKNNPKSPEWEGELLNKVASRTDLIDQAELSSLQSLHTHRHLSAHPVMTSSEALYSPNKETARAHIRNALESILTKPPIMSRKVFDTFIEDVEQLGKLQPGVDGLRRFLVAKYFRHFSPATFAQIFRSLWRITFKSTDPRADSNRNVNLQALSVVFAYRRHDLTGVLTSERDWFSDVSFQTSNLEAMVLFFQEYPQIFPILSDAVRSPIEKFAQLSFDNYALCWFVSQSAEAHLDLVLARVEAGERLNSSSIPTICASLNTHPALGKVISIGIRLYFKSGTFDAADARFDEVIRPLITSFTREHCIAFLEGCETCNNGQATCRGRAKRDHEVVRDYIQSKYADINIDDYPAFKISLGLEP